MAQNETAEGQEFGKISERLAALEERLSALEDKAIAGSRQQDLMNRIEDSGFSGGETVSVDEITIESNILEYGLSWIGIVVLYSDWISDDVHPEANEQLPVQSDRVLCCFCCIYSFEIS